MCLARNIRYLRKKKNMSQEDIAKLLGYKSFTTIQKWETGVAEPSVLIVRKLADIFGVDMNALTTQDLEKAEQSEHYVDPDTIALAQELYQNPEMHMLFDAVRTSSASDLKNFYDMIMLMKRRENPEE